MIINIVVLWSGKSSVLESIIGLDTLPRGDVSQFIYFLLFLYLLSRIRGVVTRRPFELCLNHSNKKIELGQIWRGSKKIYRMLRN